VGERGSALTFGNTMRAILILTVLLVPALVVYSAESPLTNETRTVRPATDPKKTVTIPDGMVWYDASPPTRGIRFTPGIYTLEAEDDDYLFFKSAAPLEIRVFKEGKAGDAREIPGGIMISKRFISRIPAAGYMNGEGPAKVMIWKLGRDFVRREGKDWKKSF
jgi:hypothetical protein